MIGKIAKQEKERLDSRVVFLSSVTIIYAILLLFMQKMSESSVTVTGALAFIGILRWAALAGAMLCAAWSAYKENFGFFVYCGVCLYVFLSTTVIKYCGYGDKAYVINYIALIAAFILIQIYYVLKAKSLFEKKCVKILFTAVCVLAILAAAAASIYVKMYAMKMLGL